MVEKMSADPLSLVPVTVIGNKSDDIPTNGTVAVTPKSTQPNLIVRAITPMVAIAVRFANTFLVQFSGLFIAAMTPAGGRILSVTDMPDIFLTCATLSLPGAIIGLVKDAATVFGKLEGRYPLLTGSI